MENSEIRAALNAHWTASDANDFELEHQIYRDDAVLEYPQSAERIRGRRNIQASRVAQPSLKSKRVSPHTLRHTTGMHLLQSGVPFNVIALWLGHESMDTTHRYVEANLQMKEQALARLEAPGIKPTRFRATDDLMRFLQTL